MANQVIFEIDDETKRMTAGEMLVTGSTYDVVLSGVTYAAGTSQTLFVLNERGKLLAYGSLTAGAGTISTNTQEIADEVKCLPAGAVVAFSVVLHSNVAGAPENVATGRVAVKCAGGTWSNDTTGAPTLYKGDKGDTGVGISRMEDSGVDGNGNRIVKVTYTDGSSENITVPKGADGSNGESAYEIAFRRGFTGTETQWLESLKGAPGALTMAKCNADNKWHAIEVVTNEYGDKVLALEQNGTENDPDAFAFVSRTDDQSVLGQKTFATAPLVTGQISADDDSGKTATTNWIRNLIGAGIATNVTGNVTGSILVNGLNTLNAAGATSATAPTPAESDNSTKIATTAFVKSAVGSTLVITDQNLSFEIPAATTSPFEAGKTGIGYVDVQEVPGYTPLFAYPKAVAGTGTGWVGEYFIAPSVFQVEFINENWRLAYCFHNFHYNPLAVTVQYSIIYKKN